MDNRKRSRESDDIDDTIDRDIVCKRTKGSSGTGGKTFTVRIESTNDAFYNIKTFIGKLYAKQNSDSESMDVMLGTIVTGEHPEISFTVPVDREIELKYNGETLKCNLQKISKSLNLPL